jgi:hypothetical protein
MSHDIPNSRTCVSGFGSLAGGRSERFRGAVSTTSRLLQVDDLQHAPIDDCGHVIAVERLDF